MCIFKKIYIYNNIKAGVCSTFKQHLLDSINCRLVEAVQGGVYWSSGLSPHIVATSKPEFFPSRNELGNVIESVRSDLMKEAVLLYQLSLNDSFVLYQLNNERNTGEHLHLMI